MQAETHAEVAEAQDPTLIIIAHAMVSACHTDLMSLQVCCHARNVLAAIQGLRQSWPPPFLRVAFQGSTCAISLVLAALQGIRPARQTDLAAIQELLAPLEQAGITKKRSRRELSADIPHFTVVERESKVMCCLFVISYTCIKPWYAVESQKAGCILRRLFCSCT